MAIDLSPKAMRVVLAAAIMANILLTVGGLSPSGNATTSSHLLVAIPRYASLAARA
jgi:hypothetical protein